MCAWLGGFVFGGCVEGCVERESAHVCKDVCSPCAVTCEHGMSRWVRPAKHVVGLDEHAMGAAASIEYAVEMQRIDEPRQGVEYPKRVIHAHSSRLRNSARLTSAFRRCQPYAHWGITVAVTLLAALLRLLGLDHPRRLIFDETYYVKDSYSMLTLGYEGEWAKNVDAAFAQGNTAALSPVGDFVAHPPLGKVIMAFGQELLGSDNGYGWRIATALFGVASVALLTRIAWHLFHNLALMAFAGIAMALDGMGIVLSRAALLDGILAFFVLLGFWALVRDRQCMHARAATHWRPWLIVCGVVLGAACAVKWSGIYVLAVFGIVAWVWTLTFDYSQSLPEGRHAALAPAHRRGPHPGSTYRPTRNQGSAPAWRHLHRTPPRFIFHTLHSVWAHGIPAAIQLLIPAAAAYVLAWLPWWTHPGAWGHGWAASHSAGRILPFAPNAVNDFLHYHQELWNFHVGLGTAHTYMSHPWQWILQLRPVSFYWEGRDSFTPDQCAQSFAGGSGDCVQAITSLGNIALWWPAALALLVVLWAAFRGAWRAWAILAGYIALWLPWFQYPHRTIFQFYAVAFLPFVALALTYAVAYLGGVIDKDDVSVENTTPTQPASAQPAVRLSPPTITALAALTVLMVICAVFWLPLWMGWTVPYDFWHAHMWLHSWI